MLSQRHTVQLPSGIGHIYLPPNLPEQYLITELNKKFSNKWSTINYHSNLISNPAMHAKGGLSNAFDALKKSTSDTMNSAYKVTKPIVRKASKDARKSALRVWYATRQAGQYVWHSIKDAVPAFEKGGDLREETIKATLQAKESIKKGAKHIWNAGEEAAPAVWEKTKQTGTSLLAGASDFFSDISDYGLTKYEQYQKYRLLQTVQAKREFNNILKKFKAGVLKQNGEKVTSLSNAIKIAAEKAFDTDEKVLDNAVSVSLKKGGRMSSMPAPTPIVFDKWDTPDKHIYNYAKSIKEKYPKVWAAGGNIFGNTAFKNLEKVVNRGYWLDSEEWMYKKWQGFIRRHARNKRLEGKVALLKWLSWGNGGREQTEELIDNAIKHLYNRHYAKGGIIDLDESEAITTQLQRHTARKFKEEDYADEYGNTLVDDNTSFGTGTTIYAGAVITYKPTGQKFRMPQFNFQSNNKGGFSYADSLQVSRAKAADLITLPRNVEGTNCGNCSFIKIIDKQKGTGFCIHPQVQLPVTARMCCAFWDNKGATRQWKKYQKGGEVVDYNPFTQEEQWQKRQNWIKSVLDTFEGSDEEMKEYFIERGMSPQEAEHYINQKKDLGKGEINELVKYIEPDDFDANEQEGREGKEDKENQLESEITPQQQDLLPGGKADNMPDSEFDKDALQQGTEHEMEHTDNPDIAKEIAKDHLVESPDYYKYLRLMEEEMGVEGDEAKTAEENMDFEPQPLSSDEVEQMFEKIPGADEFYLYDKPVENWDDNDKEAYLQYVKNFARQQYQPLYDNANTDADKQLFVRFVQNTAKEYVAPNLVGALAHSQEFSQAANLLSTHGYLKTDETNPDKHIGNNIIINEVESYPSEFEKLYALTGEFAQGYFAAYARIHFSPTTQGQYMPDSYKIELITDREGAPYDLDKFKTRYPEIWSEINELFENFRLTQADASEWVKYEKGGRTPRYTFPELKQIGATILSQIGNDTLQKADAHSYRVGEDKYPYITFNLGGGNTYKQITIYYKPIIDTYIFTSKLVHTFPAKYEEGQEKLDDVYNDMLSDLVRDVSEIKYANGGNTSCGCKHKMAKGGKSSGIIWIDEERFGVLPKSRVPFSYEGGKVRINLAVKYITRANIDEIAAIAPKIKVTESDGIYHITLPAHILDENYDKIDEAFLQRIQYADGGIIRPNAWQYRLMWSMVKFDGVKIWETYDEDEAMHAWDELINHKKSPYGRLEGDIELAMLDKNYYNQYKFVDDHASLKLYPQRFEDGGHLTVAKQIYNSIGGKALYMLGAKHLAGDKNSLSFKISGSPKWKYIKVALNSKDLFDITFKTWRKKDLSDIKQHTVHDVYIDNLHQIIEKETGLYTKLAKGAWLSSSLDDNDARKQVTNESNSAEKGGFAVGPSHAEGGIPGIVRSTGQHIQFEGDEAIINRKNMRDKGKYIITKPLQLKEIASCVNEANGNGVNFRDDSTPCPMKKVE